METYKEVLAVVLYIAINQTSSISFILFLVPSLSFSTTDADSSDLFARSWFLVAV